MAKTTKLVKKAPAAKKAVVKQQNVALSGKGKVMRGLVLVAKLPKTATVVVEYKKTHPLYGKSFRRSKKYLVHDEVGVKEGDIVEIHQIRPISKNKHFVVVKVTGRDIKAIVTEQLKEEAAEEIASIMPEKIEEVESKVEEKEGEMEGRFMNRPYKEKKRGKK